MNVGGERGRAGGMNHMDNNYECRGARA